MFDHHDLGFFPWCQGEVDRKGALLYHDCVKRIARLKDMAG
jgi:hypothetical protein